MKFVPVHGRIPWLTKNDSLSEAGPGKFGIVTFIG